MNLLTPTSPSPSSNTNNGDPKPDLPNPNNGETPDTHDPTPLFEDFESACSTPYVSAPSSPGRSPSSAGGGFFYSAPASPMHFVLTSNHSASSSSSYSAATDAASSSSSSFGFEFEFSARFGPAGSGSTRTMSSADELFLNGKIRPMKLSTHLERPQNLAPLLDLDPENDNDNEEEEVGLSFEAVRGRDLRLRDKSLRRRTRSMSPLRSSGSPFELNEPTKMASESKQNKKTQEEAEEEEEEEEPSVSASSSRSSSAGRNSKRWLFLKEFLRSKSEGRSNNKYFWSRSTISFSQTKEKKPINSGSSNTNNSNSNNPSTSGNEASSDAPKAKRSGGGAAKKPPPVNGVGKKKTYELHYTANRAQAEEMRKKTYLPYRQGLLGCLGFSSKGYGAVNGLARALNPVSSR